MLSKFNRLFQQFVVNEEQGGGDKLDLPLATAVLMLEIARADMDVDEQELARIHSLLCKDFDLDSDRAEALIELARQEVDSAVSAYPFTRLLVDELDMKQRETVIEYLWRVALADAELDRYEEAQIRKIAELLYLPHSAFIRAKHRAQAAQQA